MIGPKRWFRLAPLLAGTLVFASPTQAQFGGIVYDPTNYGMQLGQWTQQLAQMQQQLNAVSGSRGLANILNNPAFRQVLPQGWQQVANAIMTGGTQGLSAGAQQLYRQLLAYDSCGTGGSAATTQAQATCQAGMAMSAQRLTDLSSSLSTAQAQVGQIQSLLQAANQTQDPKAIAEVQARIQGEQAMLSNLQLQMQMVQMQNAEQDRIVALQQVQLSEQAYAQRAANENARRQQRNSQVTPSSDIRLDQTPIQQFGTGRN